MRWRLDSGQIEVVDRAVADRLRRMSITERVQMTLAANTFVRLRIEGHLRTLHADWSDAQISRETARRMLRGSD